MDYAVNLFLYVLFLNECSQCAEYDFHIQRETVGLAIGDVELLALLG